MPRENFERVSATGVVELNLQIVARNGQYASIRRERDRSHGTLTLGGVGLCCRKSSDRGCVDLFRFFLELLLLLQFFFGRGECLFCRLVAAGGGLGGVRSIDVRLLECCQGFSGVVSLLFQRGVLRFGLRRLCRGAERVGRCFFLCREIRDGFFRRLLRFVGLLERFLTIPYFLSCGRGSCRACRDMLSRDDRRVGPLGHAPIGREAPPDFGDRLAGGRLRQHPVAPCRRENLAVWPHRDRGRLS